MKKGILLFSVLTIVVCLAFLFFSSKSINAEKITFGKTGGNLRKGR